MGSDLAIWLEIGWQGRDVYVMVSISHGRGGPVVMMFPGAHRLT
jgi:hypothetical protein